jgi:TonB family protein
MQQSGLNEKKGQEEKKNSPAPKDVEALVSSFLEELANISPDGKEIQRLEGIEKQPAYKPPEPKLEPPVPERAEKHGTVSEIDFEGINREIEESLNELERLKSKVVPIADRKDPKTDVTESAKAAAKVPAAESGGNRPVAGRPTYAPAPEPAASFSRPEAPTRVKSAKSPESPDTEEQAWNRLELFRNQIVVRKPRRWLKPALGIAILIVILAVPAYQLFRLRSVQNPGDRAASARGLARSPDLDVSKGRVKAESITKVAPIYPRLPRKQSVGGTVVLEVDITEVGNVVSAKAISGPNQLRKAAEEALKKWKFKPASVNGVNIASKERISIDLEPPR